MPPSEASQALADMYRELKASVRPDFDNFVLRALSDGTWKVGAEALGVTYEESTIAGCPCIWARPEGASTNHILLYMHGGGFTLGSSLCGHRKLFAHLTKACNAQGVAVEYRQTPEHPYPAALDDSFNAYKALLDEGFAPEKIILGGDSAGGGLTAAMSLRAMREGLPKPAACIALSPWYDLTCSGQSYETNASSDALNAKPFVQMMADRYTAGKVSADDPSVSPLFADLTNLPPTWISVAGADIIADDGRRFAEKAKKASVEIVLEEHEGQQHVFEFMAGKAPEADGSLKRAGDWARKKTTD